MEKIKFYNITEDGNNLFIPAKWFNNVNLCSINNSCYDSQCYCLDNNSSNFIENMFADLKIDFFKNQEKYEDINIYGDFWNFIDNYFPNKKNEVMEWIAKNEQHTEVYATADGIILTDDYEEVTLEIQNKEIPSHGTLDHILYVKNIETEEEFKIAMSRYQGQQDGYFIIE